MSHEEKSRPSCFTTSDTSKGYQPKPKAKADNHYLDLARSPSNDGLLTLIILDITKTSSNNCLVLVLAKLL